MKKVLIFAAVAEAISGLGLLIIPSFVAQLLLGEELIGIAGPVGRVAGIALIGLGIACWLDELLGELHIAGKNEWTPFEWHLRRQFT
jgi:hypothetical protein